MMLGMSRLLSGFTDILEKIASWVGALFSIIPKTFYLLVTFAMQIVDVIQLLFQKLAGLDVYYVEGSETPESGDFLIYFLRKVLFEKGSTLNTAFWSIVIVGLFLLVFATIVAVIRTQYNYDEKPVSPTKIVGQSIKSLISFAIVPIVAFFGVYLGNIFLNALNSATASQPETIQFAEDAKIKLKPYTLSDGTKTRSAVNLFGHNIALRQDTFSGMIFRAASYRANRIRNSADFRKICDGSKETMAGSVYSGVTFGMFQVTSSDYETAANRLDDAFAYNYRLDQLAYVNWAANVETALTMSVGILFRDFTAVLYASPYQTFSRYNVAWVWFYYDLWQFDYIMAIIAIVACAVIYLNITSAMMKRAIELTMLMVVSPGVIAITPLDGGAMQKKWRENFIKKTLSAYGAVVGVNLLFIILPVIRTVNFFNLPIVDTIVQLLFTIIGLTCIKDFMKMLSDIVGGEDANAIGGEINKKIADTAIKVGTVAAGVAAPAAGVIKNVVGNALQTRREGKWEEKADKLAQERVDEKTKEYIKGGMSRRSAKQEAEKERSNFYTMELNKQRDEYNSKAHGFQRLKNAFDLEERERNSFIRTQRKKDEEAGVHYENEHYKKLADDYMKTDEAKNAVKRREANRRLVNTPMSFVSTLAGQVVGETYGDKLYGGFKSMKSSSEGKSTSAFGSAAAKDRKEAKEKEKEAREKDEAKAQQKADRELAEQQLSASQQTNQLLNDLISKMP